MPELDDGRARRPLITFFLSAYPADLYSDEDLFDPGAADSPTPLEAALSRTPPTSCSTPGKMRPGGYNKNGKYLPSKYIPGKTDKRAGK
jgi:hypothetical protein